MPTDFEIDQAIRAERAALRAQQLAVVSEKITANRNGRIDAAVSLMAAARGGSLSTEDFRSFKSATADAASYDNLLGTLGKMETEARATSIVITSEPRTYSATSPNSFFQDIASVATGGPDVRSAQAAQARLARHAEEVAIEIDRPGSPEGRTARRALRDASRKEQSLRSASEAEYRAMTSGASSGGSLVPPSYLTEQYAPFRSYVPAVADSCTSMQLPPYGLTIDVPANLGGVSVTAQSAENTDVGESDFTGVYRSVPLSTMSGYTTISQQLLDRSGPTKFDEVVYAQARDALDAQIDLLVINAMLGVATTNLTRSSFTDMSSLWSDANHAASTIETTAGTLLPATHLFLPPRNFRWFASQVDSSKRPIWTPDGDSSPDPQTGFTGYRIGGTGVFTDGSLPTVGTSNLPTFLVANPASTLLFQGEPIVGAFIEPNAASLEVIVRLYAYAAPVVRYPSAAASISGSAYPGSPSWA